MSRKYKFGDSSKLFFITYSVVNWIDVFIREEYKTVVINSWKFCQQNKGLEVYAWIIMPSHVHMVIGSNRDPLDSIVRDMKSYTSGELRKAISGNESESRRPWMMSMMETAGKKNSNNMDWQFWQQHNKPLEISNYQMFYQKLDYIHSNPVKAGFVEFEEDWLYSSARDFHNRKGLIELNYIV